MITAVLVVVTLGVLAWEYFSGPSSSDCAPVRELLSYNKTQIDALNAKTHIPAEGSFESSTQPSDLDYRNWADGLADRAAKVSAPDLAAQSKEMAETADRLIRARIDLNVQSDATAPGAPAPPAAMAVTAFNRDFEAQVSRLTKACGD
jgi:hypothetical protein